MTILCLEDFKIQFEKLKKKNSYSSVESDIIEYFLYKKILESIQSNNLYNVTVEDNKLVFKNLG